MSHMQACACWGRGRGRERTFCSTVGWSQLAAMLAKNRCHTTLFWVGGRRIYQAVKNQFSIENAFFASRGLNLTRAWRPLALSHIILCMADIVDVRRYRAPHFSMPAMHVRHVCDWQRPRGLEARGHVGHVAGGSAAHTSASGAAVRACASADMHMHMHMHMHMQM